jgi:hypothetical protein
VVSFTALPFQSQGDSSRYPLYRRLGGPQNLSAKYGEDERYLTLLGIEPMPSSPQPGSTPAELSHLIQTKIRFEQDFCYFKSRMLHNVMS